MRPQPIPEIVVPEVRDYHRINTEIVRLLDLGHHTIHLVGVEGQRLLLEGLRGPWNATVEVFGDAGSELAAELDAPELRVIARGSVADGAARDLRNGRLLIQGAAGDAVATGQQGGAVIVLGTTGHRAGLRQGGGTLVLFGGVGRLVGDRQRSGWIFLDGGRIGPNSGRGRIGGELINTGPLDRFAASLPPLAAPALEQALQGFEAWLPPELQRLSGRTAEGGG